MKIRLGLIATLLGIFVLPAYPEDLTAVEKQALAAYNQKNCPKAVDLFYQILEKEPPKVRVDLRLKYAYCLVELKRYGPAEQQLNYVVQYSPSQKQKEYAQNLLTYVKQASQPIPKPTTPPTGKPSPSVTQPGNNKPFPILSPKDVTPMPVKISVATTADPNNPQPIQFIFKGLKVKLKPNKNDSRSHGFFIMLADLDSLARKYQVKIDYHEAGRKLELGGESYSLTPVDPQEDNSRLYGDAYIVKHRGIIYIHLLNVLSGLGFTPVNTLEDGFLLKKAAQAEESAEKPRPLTDLPQSQDLMPVTVKVDVSINKKETHWTFPGLKVRLNQKEDEFFSHYFFIAPGDLEKLAQKYKAHFKYDLPARKLVVGSEMYQLIPADPTKKNNASGSGFDDDVYFVKDDKAYIVKHKGKIYINLWDVYTGLGFNGISKMTDGVFLSK